MDVGSLVEGGLQQEDGGCSFGPDGILLMETELKLIFDLNH